MTMTAEPAVTGTGWRPVFKAAGWPGAWLVTNLRYRNGRPGCVARHWRDSKRWWIVGDTRHDGITYPTRIAAALAEHELATAEPVPGRAPAFSEWAENHGMQVIRYGAAGRLPAGPDQVDRAAEAWLLAGGWRAACALTWPDRADQRQGGLDPRPTVIALHTARPGSVIADREATRVMFTRFEGNPGDGDGEDTFYEGVISQDDLFRVLMAAGLLRRRSVGG